MFDPDAIKSGSSVYLVKGSGDPGSPPVYALTVDPSRLNAIPVYVSSGSGSPFARGVTVDTNPHGGPVTRWLRVINREAIPPEFQQYVEGLSTSRAATTTGGETGSGVSAQTTVTTPAVRKGKQRGNTRSQGQNQRRRLPRLRTILILLVLVVLVVGGFMFHNALTPSTFQQPTTATIVAPAYAPVDGISCNQTEQKVFLIHAHLTIWINGKKVTVPANIGIASDQSCFYWLHTHDTTGIVFIGAPAKGNYNLKQFVDIWGNQFSHNGYPKELASSSGWTIYVYGKQVTRGFDKVVFTDHILVTIAYNSPGIHPDTQYSWPSGM